jgi:hypothetical protein
MRGIAGPDYRSRGGEKKAGQVFMQPASAGPGSGPASLKCARRMQGDGRALRLPIPSAAWQPPAARLKAHGFAPPSFDEFALSRMKGVAIRARHGDLPP